MREVGLHGGGHRGVADGDRGAREHGAGEQGQGRGVQPQQTPATSTAIAAPSSRCTPSRWAKPGTTKAKAPKQSTGIAVSTPAPADPSPVSA